MPLSAPEYVLAFKNNKLLENHFNDQRIVTKRIDIDYTDFTSGGASAVLNLITFPAGSMIVDFQINVTTLFTTNPTVSVGITEDADLLFIAELLDATGVYTSDFTATDKLLSVNETNLTTTFTVASGTLDDYAAGAMEIYITYTF